MRDHLTESIYQLELAIKGTDPNEEELLDLLTRAKADLDEALEMVRVL